MNAKTTARIVKVAKLARVASIAGLALGAVALPVSPAFAQTAPSVVEERLYGTSQWGTFPLQNINGTSTLAFDDATSSMTGQFAQAAGSDWTFGTLQQTSLKSIQSAALEVRFATAGWKDDEFVLEYTTDGWATAKQLAKFDAANPAPAGLQTFSFANLPGVTSQASANAVQVRFRTAPKAATQPSQPSGGNDRARSERGEHRDNGRGNDDKARQDNRGGSGGNNASVRIAATSTTGTSATGTSTATNTPETYTLSVDQVRLVVKGS